MTSTSLHESSSPPFDVLMIEDSDTDVLMTRKSFERSETDVNLHVVKDGVEGMRFVRREGPYANVPVPDVIVLDLNLPRKDGREVLAELKADDALKAIPVIILTTSEADEDKLRAYKLHANCYITKPVDFLRFAAAVEEIGSFWFRTVALPLRPTGRRAGSGGGDPHMEDGGP